MVHSEKLGETVLWRAYQVKISPNEKRSSWVNEVYEAAATYMIFVEDTAEDIVEKCNYIREQMLRLPFAIESNRFLVI